MNRFAIFGASGFGREVMPLALQQLSQSEFQPWDLVFIDDNASANQVNGFRVLAYEEWLLEPATTRHVNLAIGSSKIRQDLESRCLNDSVEFFQVKSPNVVIMSSVQVGVGAVLSPFVTLTSNITIGRHFHANLYSYVAHDCVIGDFVTFAPNVHCNGNVVIEDHAYIGSGAILRQGTPNNPLVIGRGAIVGMGAVVTKNVVAGTTIIGNPARVMAARVSE